MHVHVIAWLDSNCRDWAKPRFIQHKNEAKWFYRYLSIVYDHIVNPPHWNEEMRTDALEPAKLDSPDLKARRIISFHSVCYMILCPACATCAIDDSAESAASHPF